MPDGGDPDPDPDPDTGPENEPCSGFSGEKFLFTQSNDDSNHPNNSVCIDYGGQGCSATTKNMFTFGDGSAPFDDGGLYHHSGDYEGKNEVCTGYTEGERDTNPVKDDIMEVDINNDGVEETKLVKDRELCATDNQGNETCVPLVEAGTALSLIHI